MSSRGPLISRVSLLPLAVVNTAPWLNQSAGLCRAGSLQSALRPLLEHGCWWTGVLQRHVAGCGPGAGTAGCLPNGIWGGMQAKTAGPGRARG